MRRVVSVNNKTSEQILNAKTKEGKVRGKYVEIEDGKKKVDQKFVYPADKKLEKLSDPSPLHTKDLKKLKKHLVSFDKKGKLVNKK